MLHVHLTIVGLLDLDLFPPLINIDTRAVVFIFVHAFLDVVTYTRRMTAVLGRLYNFGFLIVVAVQINVLRS